MKIAENVSQKNDECVLYIFLYEYKKIKGINIINKREFFIIYLKQKTKKIKGKIGNQHIENYDYYKHMI